MKIWIIASAAVAAAGPLRAEDAPLTFISTEQLSARTAATSPTQWSFTVVDARTRVEYEENGKRLPCPLKWLDSFSMRNFTNASVFDDTLPVSDGRIEIGSAVPVEDLKAAMQDWFQRKGYLPKDSHLVLAED